MSIRQDRLDKKLALMIQQAEDYMYKKSADTAANIIAGFTNKKVIAVTQPITNPTEFYAHWVDQLHFNYDDIGCLPPFTGKEKGQVKVLIKLWGPECTRSILTLVINQWIQFIKSNEEITGAYKSPMRPTLYYLHLHRVYAKNYWWVRKDSAIVLQSTMKKKLIVKSNTAAQELLEPNPLQSVAIEPVEKPATLEDIEAIMADLKSKK
jgi:hypothetical protein